MSRTLFVWMASFCLLASDLTSAFAKPAVEIIPVAVWQGKTQTLLNAALIDDLRKSWPDSRIAHAVSAAPFIRSDSESRLMRNQLKSLVRAGDDILLHMAPWKSLAAKASVSFKDAPTLFGVKMTDQDCATDCGLELSFTAFSSPEIAAMVAVSRKVMAENGLGSPGAIYFEEGVTASTLHVAARQQGILQDWSGIEMSQMKSSLGRFPIYLLNKDYVATLPLTDQSKEQNDGLFLDHVRFGVHAEIADIESSTAIFKLAVEQARKSGRVVRIPIAFNVDDLYYTQGFVREAVLKAREIAISSGIVIAAWAPQNLTWSFGPNSAPVGKVAPIAMAARKSEHADDEPEFISQEEAELEASPEYDVMAH